MAPIFKNISFTNCKLYGEIEIEDEQPILENGEDFYSNSENTSFAFLYNDDCITRSDASTSTKEIFSIDYSVGYQQ